MTADGDREETYTGTPQGGILSPLLANIALSALDEHFARQWQAQMGTRWQRKKRRRQGPGQLAAGPLRRRLRHHGERRPAHHAEALREEAAAVLAPLGLRLAEEKTRVVHIDEGFDFLGFTIRRMRKRGTAKHYVYTVPSRKAIQAIKDKVSAKTYRSTRHQDLADAHPEHQPDPGRVGELLPPRSVQSRLQRDRRPRVGPDHALAAAQVRTASGCQTLRRRFCVPGTWKFAANGVRFTGASAVPVTRYRYRGSTIPTPWTPQPVPAPG